MDGIITTIVGVAPQLGVAGTLLIILMLVIRSGSQDRVEFRESLAAANTRFKDEITRINADHDMELAELRDEIKKLRIQIEELNKTIDTERRARREAEDVAARAVRDAGSAFTQYLAPGSVPRHRQDGETT